MGAENLEDVRGRWINPNNHLLKRMGVPERYWSARLADFDGVEEVCGKRPNADGAFLCGPAGTGKTHLATALLVAALPGLVRQSAAGTTVLRPQAVWASFPEVLMGLRATFSRARLADSEADIVGRLVEADILVLDDLGAEKMTEWTGQSVYLVISQRLNKLRPTIVTSNLVLAEMNELDPRLASRLGGMTYVRVGGADRRVPR